MPVRTPKTINLFDDKSKEKKSISSNGVYFIDYDRDRTIATMIADYLSDEDNTSPYAVGWLEFSSDVLNLSLEDYKNSYTQFFSNKPKEAGAKDLHFSNERVSLRYLTQEYKPSRSEDFTFIGKLLLASSANNPLYTNPQDRALIAEKKIFFQTGVRELSQQYFFSYEDFYGEISPVFRRYFTQHLATVEVDFNYDIYFGLRPLSYSQVSSLSRQERYNFLYLYLYRIYDLIINRKENFYGILVLNNLQHLLERDYKETLDGQMVKSYSYLESFYDYKKGQGLERLEQILIMLKHIFEVARERKLTIITSGALEENLQRLNLYSYGETLSNEEDYVIKLSRDN